MHLSATHLLRAALLMQATAAAADIIEPGPAPALVWEGAQWPGA